MFNPVALNYNIFIFYIFILVYLFILFSGSWWNIGSFSWCQLPDHSRITGFSLPHRCFSVQETTAKYQRLNSS
jgi:hypothetical protein